MAGGAVYRTIIQTALTLIAASKQTEPSDTKVFNTTVGVPPGDGM